MLIIWTMQSCKGYPNSVWNLTGEWSITVALFELLDECSHITTFTTLNEQYLVEINKCTALNKLLELSCDIVKAERE